MNNLTKRQKLASVRAQHLKKYVISQKWGTKDRTIKITKTTRGVAITINLRIITTQTMHTTRLNPQNLPNSHLEQPFHH